jgi:hypothetical protein
MPQDELRDATSRAASWTRFNCFSVTRRSRRPSVISDVSRSSGEPHFPELERDRELAEAGSGAQQSIIGALSNELQLMNTTSWANRRWGNSDPKSTPASCEHHWDIRMDCLSTARTDTEPEDDRRPDVYGLLLLPAWRNPVQLCVEPADGFRQVIW